MTPQNSKDNDKPWELREDIDFLAVVTQEPYNPTHSTIKEIIRGSAFWLLFSLGLLMIALSGCSVPKGELEFDPVVTEEVYDLGPYEE